jgi:hypothetical protein
VSNIRSMRRFRLVGLLARQASRNAWQGSARRILDDDGQLPHLFDPASPPITAHMARYRSHIMLALGERRK